jgi:hypothetical protein
MEKKDILGRTECTEARHDEIPQRMMAEVILCLKMEPKDISKFKEILEGLIGDINGFRQVKIINIGEGLCPIEVKVNIDYGPITIYDEDISLSDAKRAIIREHIPKIEDACIEAFRQSE